MPNDSRLPALVDIDEIADRLGLPPTLTRAYLDSRNDHAIATHRGRELWLADTVHDALAERQAVAECSA